MKALKDPIYGYIRIPDFLFEKIIDTPEFQRLRGITQTSYAPLYASAVHNRFVHSLGVYYLGKTATSNLQNLYKENSLINGFDRWCYIFELACLLHDVGHAPFSHTGENFYPQVDVLHKEIIELTNDSTLAEEIKAKDYKAATHELMSVIVSLKTFSFLFKSDEERSFFTRCILGYSHVNNLDKEKSILNCLISLLNSSIIDVDKLDYLIRDAYITGYDTVSIDYERLLNSLRIVESKHSYKLVFSQSAISVIENVVFAHDSERKWIQNHPIVQYEAFLLRHAMEVLNSQYCIFNFDALTKKGMRLQNGCNISLMTDGDVSFLMKNISDDCLIDEYFSRNERRHPLWKSEAEYKAIFNRIFTTETYQILEEKIENLVKYLSTVNGSNEINNIAFSEIKDDIEKSKTVFKGHKEALTEKHNQLKLVECFKSFAEEEDIDFDFVIITAKRFYSGFDKFDFGKIEIQFSSLGDLSLFKAVANPLCSNTDNRDKYFYVFYRRKDPNQQIDVTLLARKLNAWAVTQVYES